AEQRYKRQAEEDRSKRTTIAGPSNQEGEVDKKWLEEVERIDDYLITRLQGTVPSALLLHLMKERLTRLGIHPENECLFSEAIESFQENHFQLHQSQNHLQKVLLQRKTEPQYTPHLNKESS